jgi:hypothetical protein
VFRDAYSSVFQTMVSGGVQALSEEKALQKLCQALSE